MDTPIAPRARWPEPQPMRRGRPPVPALHGALLPGALAPWIADVAERVQCPPDFVAVGVLVAAAAVIGRKLAIRPKRQDDWAVVPNLWGLAVGPPGMMKSPALAEALRPLHRLVTDAQAQHEEQMLTHQFRVAEQKARRHDLARRLRAAVEDEAPTEELRQQFEAMRYTPPVAKRYLVNDTTVEKLGELLNHHPNGLLLFRDELSGWLHTMDRPGHENDRAFYCEAWNGTSAYTYDRIGQAPAVASATNRPDRPGGFVGFVADSRVSPCGAQRGGETKPNRSRCLASVMTERANSRISFVALPSPRPYSSSPVAGPPAGRVHSAPGRGLLLSSSV